MRFDELTEALRFLPPILNDRVMALRPYLADPRCETCRQIADALYDAVTAARYDENIAAGHLLARAETLAGEHQHGTGPTGCAVRRLEPGAAGRRGQLGRWARTASPLVAATDASWKGRAGGIAYVVSDGRWGLRSRSTGRLAPTGPSRPDVRRGR
jgi:hypothetical protein